MSYSKLARYNEILSFPNVIDKTDENIKTKVIDIIKTKDKTVLELACGWGEYTIDLAKVYPDTNFIGIDVKGDRIWKGAKLGITEGISNAFFIRTFIESLNEIFPEDSVDEIWITFPDPFLPNSDAKRRLTHPKFLEVYKKLIKKDGIMHLKTDSKELYDFTMLVIKEEKLNLIENNDNVILEKLSEDSPLKIQTKYEKKFRAVEKPITYIKFKF